MTAKKSTAKTKTPAKGKTTRAKAKPGDKRLGSKSWTKRLYHRGPPKKYSTPEKLWDACVAYFEWAEDNPLTEEKIFSFQGETHTGSITKMRAMTLRELCLYINIDPKTWASYRTCKDVLPITKRVEDIIYTQKFTGAAADLLNPNIIARELGLKDANIHEISGPGGEPIQTITSEMTAKEATEIYRREVEGDR